MDTERVINMTTYNSQILSESGRIIADTRPGRADIYLDGQAVMDSSGKIAKTPTVIYNISEGYHTVTFSREGYNAITMSVNVAKGSDCHARALLNTSMITYTLMMSGSAHQTANQEINQMGYQTTDVCGMLKSAVDDEFGAINEYPLLLNAIDAKYHDTIKGIIEDETEHYNKLGKILEEMRCPGAEAETGVVPVLEQSSLRWPNLPIHQVSYGYIATSTSPYDADIYLDGEPVLDINGNIATTPSSVTGIITGMHAVTFKKAGYRDASVTVNIQNGLYSDARATLQSITV